MNTLGTLFRVHIFGESHADVMGITLDGVPAGIPLMEADFLQDITRRKPSGIGTTPRVEEDTPRLLTGVFNAHSTGAPLTILFENKNTKSSDYAEMCAIPRPGHADFVARKKYGGFTDYRGSGHFSGRLTLGLVAAGVIAKKILQPAQVRAELTELGGDRDIEAARERAFREQNSVGGVIKCTIEGLPAGLGEPFFGSVESLLSLAMFSIPAVKAVGFGSGTEAARMKGSEHNDAILDEKGTTRTNYAGGINGGITNGNPVYFELTIKPASSIPREQRTFNMQTGEMDTLTVRGRHDLCIALRAPVVVEAVAAIVMADLLLLAQQRGRVFTNKENA